MKKMKVVYHEKYRTLYSSDPASAPGRIESIYKELQDRFEFVKPEPASEEDLRLVHGELHINSIKRNELLYEVAVLAVGGAIKASELAMRGEPAFGLIRPPGHHASQNSCWGFCFFNNVAISIEKLRRANKITKALIVDIDLHYGDGTNNIFSGKPQVTYFHVEGRNREMYLNDLTRCLTTEKDCDIVAVSAGFDRHEQDWGSLLKTEDYGTIGKMVKEFAENVCEGRRYAVLEGGYNHTVLGKNVKSLLEGIM
ncbi:MAG: Histone deacetylase domain protein [Candidatus Bathyarchaeota archaeon BA2]|nr:MAG: Histone deacetylase domain protein [Candidatus Bathyarchaeota archaeon BA2]